MSESVRESQRESERFRESQRESERVRESQRESARVRESVRETVTDIDRRLLLLCIYTHAAQMYIKTCTTCVDVQHSSLCVSVFLSALTIDPLCEESAGSSTLWPLRGWRNTVEILLT